ncbi:hypothetical protein T4A_2071 [Trichinella pseudospiralis]|uniref:Uncharacterized protein n=1 Tax=Trichinella pseudospiralis TaxID=6337 RepID=A0A0V1EPE8_TRIPS|nr:hypothetical protein T4A_2071 [Trichinella pseudospiralis]
MEKSNEETAWLSAIERFHVPCLVEMSLGELFWHCYSLSIRNKVTCSSSTGYAARAILTVSNDESPYFHSSPLPHPVAVPEACRLARSPQWDQKQGSARLDCPCLSRRVPTKGHLAIGAKAIDAVKGRNSKQQIHTISLFMRHREQSRQTVIIFSHEASTRQARATSFAVHRVRTAEGWIDVYDPPWVKISTANLSVRHVEFEAEKPEVQVLGQRWGTRGQDSRAGGPPPQPKTFF